MNCLANRLNFIHYLLHLNHVVVILRSNDEHLHFALAFLSDLAEDRTRLDLAPLRLEGDLLPL